jgi:DNA polymerase III gamma/tau subunit
LIILTTSKLERIPKTIISRCQQVKFKRIANDDLISELKTRKVKDAELLTSLSVGRPGLVMTWLNDDESLIQIKQSATNFINLISGDNSQRLQFVETLLPKGLSLLDQANLALSNIASWQITVRDILLLRSGISDKITNIQAVKELNIIAKQCSNQQLINWHKKMDLTKEYLKQNVNPRLVLENLLLKIDYHA